MSNIINGPRRKDRIYFVFVLKIETIDRKIINQFTFHFSKCVCSNALSLVLQLTRYQLLFDWKLFPFFLLVLFVLKKKALEHF